MILFYILPLIYTLKLKIKESSPSHGTLSVKSSLQQNSFLILSFPKQVFPYLFLLENINIYKIYYTNDILHAILFFESNFQIQINYKKNLYKIHDYPINIDEGITFPKSILITKSHIIYSNTISDSIYIPDFTVPFISFSICGSAFTILLNLVVKYHKKNYKKY
ncbi:hypothetical protein CWI36_1049p0010 [Hamiltosporidium magnivora]|uniref:Uncharacterized protein n=1 Tax=Hamiltosporidium magnivora TaxID=148818 RepID=A0A4V2JV61_9MICR|nr:hypothetical protein CWI36_1049p0010 [Hamiltosporidium magnivora]